MTAQPGRAVPGVYAARPWLGLYRDGQPPLGVLPREVGGVDVTTPSD